MTSLFRSIVSHLLLFLMLPFCLLLIWWGFSSSRIVKVQKKMDLLESAEKARAAISSDGAFSFSEKVDYVDFCRQLSADDYARAVIIDQNGSVRGDSEFGKYKLQDHQIRDDLKQALLGESISRIKSDNNLKEDVLYAAVPLRNEENKVVGAIGLSMPWHAKSLLFRNIITTAILPIVILAVLIVITAWLLSRNFSESLQDFIYKARTLGGLKLADSENGERSDPFFMLTTILNRSSEILSSQIKTAQRESEQMDQLFTSMREGVIAVDNALHILTINQSARRFLQIPDAVVIKEEPLVEVVRNAALNEFIRNLISGGAGYQEAELHAEESDRYYRMSGVQFQTPNNDEPGALVVMHDITRVKQLEAMRTDFVANVSHELKTPLTAIKGFLEHIQDCLREDPKQAEHFLEIIARHTDRSNAIIDDLLTLSQLEQQEPNKSDVVKADISETIAMVLNYHRSALKAKNIEIVNNSEALPIKANHRLLQQAIGNLIQNAIKYSPEGSAITIGLRTDSDQVHIDVRDQGIGISREHHTRIFERFYRVDKSRDRETGGTGLGLAIVKHIALIHGGNVSLKSEVGKGSTFTLTLPR